MPESNDLFDKYDQLLPSKYQGGLLVIELYQRIKSKALGRHFTGSDIKYILESIARYDDAQPVQTEKIIKQLIHFFIRNVPLEPGKYYLTDHAESLVELMLRKLDNPYKDFQLKANFEKYFSIRLNEIRTIDDLERRFGREFVSGHKRILKDHLETLEDTLEKAYETLNTILNSADDSATEMVKKFVLVFHGFGERAEDIADAIASKDRFMRSLRTHVDMFYQQIEDFKHPETAEENQALAQVKINWSKATDIYADIEAFFETIDYKIGNIRRQIHRASEKLSELHENFSARSHFRIQVKRLYQTVLVNTTYREDEQPFVNEALVKGLVFEKIKFHYPEYYDYGLTRSNMIVEPEIDEDYQRHEMQLIEAAVKQQEVINFWVDECKKLLATQDELELGDLMEAILAEENDLTVAYHVAIELTQFVSEHEEHHLEILAQPFDLKNTSLTIWKMKMKKLRTFVS
jgi:chaperonin cofactor prefoldin